MDDLISRKDVENALDNNCTTREERKFWGYVLRELPTVDAVQVVHGEWIDKQEDDATEGMWRCSACGSDRYFDIMTPLECGCFYCPNCGARMDLEEMKCQDEDTNGGER